MIDDIRLIYSDERRPMQQNAEAATEISDAKRNSGLNSHTFETGIEKPPKASFKTSHTVALPCPAAPSQATVFLLLPEERKRERKTKMIGQNMSVTAAASQCLQKRKYPHFLALFLRDCLRTLYYRRRLDLPSLHPHRRWNFQTR